MDGYDKGVKAQYCKLRPNCQEDYNLVHRVFRLLAQRVSTRIDWDDGVKYLFIGCLHNSIPTGSWSLALLVVKKCCLFKLSLIFP